MIIPVILAGGTGTRLWPLSRKAYPKQFTELVGEESLFQATAQRLSGPEFEAPTILTNSDFRFIAAEQLDDIGVAPGSIMIEPTGRNTAPAILAAALAHEDTPDAVLLVAPSDHVVVNQHAFMAAIKAGEKSAVEGKLVTFGIRPVRAETGYGYLGLAKPLEGFVPEPVELRSFIEKPQIDVAETMLASGRHLWNSGIFMFRVDAIIDAFEKLSPALLMPCRAAVAMAKEDLCFTRLGPDAWARCEDISIDYAVMEAAETLTVIPLDCGWSDLGSWKSVMTDSPSDRDGNVLSANTTALNCSDTQLRSVDANMELVGIGLEGITAIATRDAVLVARTDDSEQVKKALQALKEKEVPQAEEFDRCYRPWGYYETLSLSARFQVKRIMVKPGAALSLQSHVHRAEHWVVVKGSANVTVDESITLMTENQSVYIPLGAIHRLENPGKVDLHLIEVQTGSYLGEDDIIRYEDVYARVEEHVA
ncbi:mannose-1-phosphate guanylyltransferase/mannose-6-phosphate isomerase [Halocynthiibacter namhaensis]|uniref:mannose-1-phosphate guanylyltransferase/mannose-6-phosphate isomerase n=1 Tax=Halocynthiibacter namhaensis TaxID=1290553 RepID=UPI000579018C|nr:mannose-1-phosphate guanylyltransferase/mannose-6-phosphate isomerase [Halocynthiibacter namhaensis]